MKKLQIHKLIDVLGQIKNLRRSGWIKRNVSEPESDADHMYSMALEIILLAPDHLDKCHCLELALTHDLQEIYASDFVPGEKSKEEKHQIELQAVQRLSAELEFPELLDWFLEFDAQSTPEARFVACLDKTDNIITAAYYEKEKRTQANLLDEFAPHAIKCIAQIPAQEKNLCIDIISQIWRGAR